MDRRDSIKLLTYGTAMAALPASGAMAATFPERSVKIIVGFPPGSAPDSLARMSGGQLQSRLGQPVIVENRPGAGGNI